MTSLRALTRWCLALSLALCTMVGMALAQAPGSAPPAKAPRALPDSDSRVHLLLDLLADPQVRDWLEKQRAEGKAKPPAATEIEISPFQAIAAHLDAIRKRLKELARAAPGVPAELERARGILGLEIEERGWLEIAVLVSVFVGLGLGAECLFWWATRHFRPRLANAPLDTVADRGRAVLMRLGFGLAWIASFTVGSLGGFLPFHWPPLIRQIVLSLLIAFLVTRLAIVVGRFLLAPGAERFRIVPLATPAASHWHRRLAFAAGVGAFAYVAISLLTTLGVSSEGVRLIAATFGLALLAIGAEMVIRRPPASDEATGSSHRWGAVTVLTILFFFVLWLFRLTSQMPLFWTATALVGVPCAIALTRRSLNHVLRPAGGPDASPLLAGLYTR